MSDDGGSWLLPGRPVRPPNLRRLRRIGGAVFLTLMVAACIVWAVWGR